MFKYYLIVVLIINIILIYRVIENQKIEYLITPIKNGIYYKCRNREINFNREFKCPNFMEFNDIKIVSTGVAIE